MRVAAECRHLVKGRLEVGAGLDASVLAATSGAGSSARAPEQPGELLGLVSYLLRVPKPVIAAVNGPAAGGGFVLAMLSDVRFASSAASFTTVFSKRGLIAEHGTSWILPRLVGAGRALVFRQRSGKLCSGVGHRRILLC